jgi:hypothetical protein
MGGVSTASLPALLAGRYRVLASVGRGAIAEVVRARDEQTGAEIALKILYPHLRESAAVVERFRREVEIVRRIAHPNVLAIHDVVERDDQLFLVMDYHPGGDLADRLARKGRLSAEEVRELAAQLCGGLAAAHRAGVVHRDVKPSNVLCGAGAGLDVRLCDFGLARATELSGLTTANAVLGTPEYMAPEVVTDGHADPRSDIYSLGVMLFEAATGKLPFYGDSPYQLMRQHVDVEAPRARERAPELPAAIDATIARALAKDPLDRFATVEDLARALAVETSPVTLAPVPATEAPSSRRTCRRCGGWLVDAAGVCADCGRIMLRLDYQRGGVSVIVTGPGKPADKIDAQKQVALYKILDELPAGAVTIPRRLRGAPRVPFYVAKSITRVSADALVERLQAIGLEGGIREELDALAGQAMQKKLWELTYRPLAGFGFLFTEGWRFIPKSWPVLAFFAPLLVIGGAWVFMLGRAINSCRRAIVQRPRRQEGVAAGRLPALIGSLASRQDRRLVAHVLERLGQLEALGQAQTAGAIADRAVKMADALVLFDERRRVHASVSVEPAAALEELRREEVLRVVARADLLRTSSWLDRFCLGLSRANAASAAETAAEIAREIEELERVVAAQGEVEMMLREAR